MKRLLCSLFGHKLRNTPGTGSSEMACCSRCQQQFWNHPSGTEFALNTTWQQNRDLFEKVFDKKY